MAACQEDKHPYEIVVNGTTGPVLLPSPPSTVSSMDTPREPLSSPPGFTSNNNKNNSSKDGDSGNKNKRNKKQRPQQQQRARRPTLPQSAVFAPRPVQDLLAERAYLVDSLAAQGARATELIRLLAAAERTAAESEAAGASGERRRLRKRVSLLKSKIAVAADQEKAVIVRLGELYVEMQSRERWARVRLETGFSEGYFPPVPMHSHLHMQMPMPMPTPLPVVPLQAAPDQVAPPRLAPVQEAAPVAAREKRDLSGVSISTGLSPESPEFVPSWPRWANPWPMPDPTPPEQGELTLTKGPE